MQELHWSRENLYGLLFHQLGNHTGPEAERFRAVTEGWRRKDEDGCVRFVAPVGLVADQERQEQVFVTLAGPFMGTDRRKGHTYTWVPNHLQDGRGQVSPRTWLYALGRAAAITGERYAGHPVPLHYEAIRDSISGASSLRVDELREDIGWAATAIGQLAGGQVPMEPSVVHAHWRQGSLAAKLREALAEESEGSGPREVDNPVALIEELTDLGVMTTRPNGAIDLPDVYRLAFGIGRRGGVARKQGG
ncbi:hypothetical protein KBZ10_15925 [Streptomyces sp. F63]|uniref:hypothetical protein n=1 Tax=Streptomyces sp. F63 TaxID=2824887 RepID=UPI001B35F616|nr:hypothetical protein [Streptomyces sp. F63]MBQ0985980.1 hypothetical protein [Streptomyces sp. F63]